MRHFGFLLPVVLAFAACSPAEPPATDAAATVQTQPDGRLPQDVSPQRYAVQLTMNPDEESFRGRVAIDVELTEPRDVIWLHGWQLRMDKAVIELADGSELEGSWEQVGETGLAKFSLPESVQPQNATLKFDYTADFFSGLDGAYRVKSGDDWYVFTQFEPIHARRVFPSFDEPAFKTPFSMEFVVPEGDRVVANTPQTQSAIVENGMQRHVFMETKPLPTYLVAFAIGPLDIVEGPAVPTNALREEPIPVRGVTVKGKGAQIEYALRHTHEFVSILEEYFGIPYPYEKLDIIAVPDFSAGAMENAGAITFREVLLLIPDPDEAPTWQLRAYAEVMAHELGHQWFGNLVTMPWWDDIWLNEAFASWIEAHVMEKWNPEHPVQQGLANTIQYAMRADSLANARQIRQPIESSHDIENAFDGITYSKGSSVLLMFEQYLGEEVFRQGVQHHLKRFAWGNADVFDFLESLSAVAGKDIAPAFKSFLFQPGVPLLDVTLDCANGAPRVALTQSRYLPQGSKANRDQQWQLPVCMKFGAGGGAKEQCFVLTEQQASFDLDSKSCPDWLIPNAGGVGYYHWTLDDAGYDALLAARDQLDLMELLALENSVNAGFAAGKLDTAAALGALAPLTSSSHFEVAEAPMSIVGVARRYLVDRAQRGEVETYAQKLYDGDDLTGAFTPGKAASDPLARDHQATVAGFLIDAGQHDALRAAAAKAGRALVGFGDDGEWHAEAVTPDFAALALATATEESGDGFHAHLVELFKNSDDSFVRLMLLRAIGIANAPDAAARVENLLLDPVLKRNEVPRLLYSYALREETRERAWDWLQQNFDAVVAVMAPDHASGLPSTASGFCSDERAGEVKAFFAERVQHLPGGPRNLALAVESIELCAAQRAAHATDASAFFSR